MTEYVTRVRLLTSGWLRWQAYCTCGWTGQRGGQLEAETVRDLHADSHISPACRCYDTASLEWAPVGTCPVHPAGAA